LKALEQLDDAIADANGQCALYPLNLEGALMRDYEELSERIKIELSHLDAVFMVSALASELMPMDDIEPELWLKLMHVNCIAPSWLLTAVMPLLRESGGFVAAALPDPTPLTKAFWSAYGASQAAWRNVLSCASDESERLGPRIFASTLPPFQSKLRLKAFPAEAHGALPTPESMARRWLSELEMQIS
jgi:NAD(P)-dependent dehydrogenase (short-subunit alcohol dehydrogenase family)